MLDIIIGLVIVYLIGSFIERNHYKKIRRQELSLYKHGYINFAKNVNVTKPVKNVELVSSSVVIGCDNFKHFLAGLINIFGGNISAYESVLDRARREALLRIRTEALRKNANLVLNVKIETIMLDPIGATRKAPKVCVTAYGTAIEYAK